MSKFKPFFFDGNAWVGIVRSKEDWFSLLLKYPDYEQVLKAKMAPQAAIDTLPTHYHFGAVEVRTGEMPSFGFRREHVNGTVLLEDWANKLGMDLRSLSMKPSKKRWWLLWWW